MKDLKIRVGKKDQEILEILKERFGENQPFFLKEAKKLFPQNSKAYLSNYLTKFKRLNLVLSLPKAGSWKIIGEKTEGSPTLRTLFLSQGEKSIFLLLSEVDTKQIGEDTRFTEASLLSQIKKEGFREEDWKSLKKKMASLGMISPRTKFGTQGGICQVNQTLLLEYLTNENLLGFDQDSENNLKKKSLAPR